MKRILLVVSMLAASMLYTAVPALTEEGATVDEHGINKMFESRTQKDECLIVARNCSGADDVMQRAERLQREIDKGSAVYSPEELKRMHEQLNWIYSEDKAYSVRDE